MIRHAIIEYLNREELKACTQDQSATTILLSRKSHQHPSGVFVEGLLVCAKSGGYRYAENKQQIRRVQKSNGSSRCWG